MPEPDDPSAGDRPQFDFAPAYAPFVRALRQTESVNARDLDAYQRMVLGNLLAHAARTVPDLRLRLKPLFGTDGAIDWGRWGEVPVLTRRELHGDEGRFLSNDVPLKHGRLRDEASSGSTGIPLRTVTTDLGIVSSACAEHLSFAWHGCDLSRRLAVIRYWTGQSHRAETVRGEAGWSPVAAALGADGDMFRLDITEPVGRQLAWLERVRPAYLVTMPSNLRELARAVLDENRDLRLERIFTLGEYLPDETRDLAMTAFGAPVAENYSASEAGVIALQCETGAWHLASPVTRVEILRTDGATAQAGETGEVVVTPLYNYAMPLVRYALGDLAEAGGTCGCGRSWPVMARVHGRVRAMFRFPDGTTLFPIIHSNRTREFVDFRQYQVAQTGPLEIEIRVAGGDENAPADMEGLTAYAREALGQPVTVKLKRMDAIARGKSHKFEDYLCELPGA